MPSMPETGVVVPAESGNGSRENGQAFRRDKQERREKRRLPAGGFDNLPWIFFGVFDDSNPVNAKGGGVTFSRGGVTF